MHLSNTDTTTLKYAAVLFYTRILPHGIKAVTYHSPSCAIITLTLSGFLEAFSSPSPSYFSVIITRLLSKVKFCKGEEELGQISQMKF